MAKFICNKKGMLLGAHVLGRDAREIIDNVYIGQRLDALYNIVYARTAGAFNYQDILHEISLQCAVDIQKSTEVNPGVVDTILSLFG